MLDFEAQSNLATFFAQAQKRRRSRSSRTTLHLAILGNLKKLLKPYVRHAGNMHQHNPTFVGVTACISDACYLKPSNPVAYLGCKNAVPPLATPFHGLGTRNFPRFEHTYVNNYVLCSGVLLWQVGYTNFPWSNLRLGFTTASNQDCWESPLPCRVGILRTWGGL